MDESSHNSDIKGFVTLTVPARYSYLRIIRQSVLDLCARAGISEFDASQLEMAVDESCANIIEHSYGKILNDDKDLDETLGLTLNLIQHEDRIVVELCDSGKGFDFKEHEFPDPVEYLDRGHDRGLGMFIIHHFVDDISYEKDTPNGNCLRLTKRL